MSALEKEPTQFDQQKLTPERREEISCILESYQPKSSYLLGVYRDKHLDFVISEIERYEAKSGPVSNYTLEALSIALNFIPAYIGVTENSRSTPIADFQKVLTDLEAKVEVKE